MRSSGASFVFVRQRAQLVDQRVEFRQQDRAPRFGQHQRVAEIVDVLAGAGEVHEFQRRAEFGVVLELFLDQVFDRLDVVVGRGLDRLDPRRVLDRKTLGQRAQPRGGGGGERLQFDDARIAGQRQQPFDFHLHPRPDQAVFGEDRAQRVDLAGVAAIERGQGGEGVGHGAASAGGEAQF